MKLQHVVTRYQCCCNRIAKLLQRFINREIVTVLHFTKVVATVATALQQQFGKKYATFMALVA